MMMGQQLLNVYTPPRHSLRLISANRVNGFAQMCRRLSDKPVLGCGSNVVDHIYNVKVIPNAGQKGYFRNPFKAIEHKLLGGVILNHLSWAAISGVHTGLLALQGEDELGYFIRRKLGELNVDTRFIKTDNQFSTGQSHVFIQEDGERSIHMATGSTSIIDAQVVAEYFEEDIQKHACMVTTEISQVPLSGVLALLRSARKANVLSVLDLDVPPHVAVDEAKLGTMEELVECVRCADVLKPAHATAAELLSIVSGEEGKTGNSLCDMARELIKDCDSKFLAITNGDKGSVLANAYNVVEVEAPSVSRVVDTTGAGDAFLGGLIVGMKANGLPQTVEELRAIGRIANAYGAACTQAVGGVPVKESGSLIQSYIPDESSAFVSRDVSRPINNKIPSTFSQSIRRDIDGAKSVASGLDPDEVVEFLRVIEECEGQLFLSGIGKSGQVAQRFSSSLSSVGISSQYVHAAEWVHGDLGKVQAGKDVVLFISHSGNTEECVIAAKKLIEKEVTTLTITSKRDSRLRQLSRKSLVYSRSGLQEPFGCLPTTSIVIQDIILNAIISELIHKKSIKQESFKSNHPGGSIGAK